MKMAKAMINDRLFNSVPLRKAQSVRLKVQLNFPCFLVVVSVLKEILEWERRRWEAFCVDYQAMIKL